MIGAGSTCCVCVLRVCSEKSYIGISIACPAAQAEQVLHQQLGFEAVGMVVVGAHALVHRQLALVAVVVVMLDIGDVIDVDRFLDAPADRGLAAARAARHANHERLLPGSCPAASGSWGLPHS